MLHFVAIPASQRFLVQKTNKDLDLETMRAAVLRQPLSRLVRREVVQPIVLRGRNTWQVGSWGIFSCAFCRPCLEQDVLACTKFARYEID